MARSFVIGGAGFIGSHLVDRLVERGPVVAYDDLSSGERSFIQPQLDAGRCTLIEGDALDLEHLTAALAPDDVVFHFAANPEARAGLSEPRRDLEQGTIATWNVLEAMRRAGPRRLVFASSGTVYGEGDEPRAEGDLGALPISLYGASKLAGEAMIGAYSHCFDLRAWIFRFGNVIGPRGTHGAALDFLKRLAQRPDTLEVLGDGSQSKPYLHVEDCVAAVLFGLDHAADALNVLNVAPSDVTSVTRIAESCVAASPQPAARLRFTGGERGWPGDVPRSRLDASRLERLGFRLRWTSDEAVARAVRELAREVFG